MEGIVSRPHISLHGYRIAHEYVEALKLLGKLGNGLHLLHDKVVIIALEHCHEGRCDSLAVHLDGEHGVSRHLARELDHVGVHIFDDGRRAVRAENGLCRLDAAFRVHERQKQNRVGLGLVDEPECELGDDAESALAADDIIELFLFVNAHGAAVRRHDERRGDIVAGAAVFDRAGAARVGRGVAAYCRGLFAGIGGIVQPVLFRLGLDVLQKNARLHRQGALIFVKAEHLVHALERQYNAALYGNAAARLTRAGAANGHADRALGA